MSVIPPDICDVANQILVRFLNTRGDDLCEEVCRALMAERERCAKIAEETLDEPFAKHGRWHGNLRASIVAAIRA